MFLSVAEEKVKYSDDLQIVNGNNNTSVKEIDKISPILNNEERSVGRIHSIVVKNNGNDGKTRTSSSGRIRLKSRGSSRGSSK